MTAQDAVETYDVAPRWGTGRSAGVDTLGGKMADLADLVGIDMMPWQRHVTDVALEVDDAGQWLHPTVAVIVGRQNGKTALLMARILHALFVGDEKLILYSAQDRTQARTVFEELESVILTTPALKPELMSARHSIGNEAMRMQDGTLLRILSARQAAWRGYSADLIVLDETRETKPETMTAARYTTRARPNPQLWTASTAGGPDAVLLRDIVARGRTATTDSGSSDPMAYFEWSAAGVEPLDPSDPDVWRMANPALGHLLRPETLVEELRADPDGFLVESLCIPTIEAGSTEFVDAQRFEECRVAGLQVDGLERLHLGVDMDQDRTAGSIVAAGWDGDTLVVGTLETFVDPVEHAVIAALQKWKARLGAKGVAMDPRTCGGIADRLTLTGTQVHLLTSRRMPGVTARLVEVVQSASLVHDDDGTISESLYRTVRRVRTDGGWSIRRRDAHVEICTTMALLAAVDAAAVPRAVLAIH